MRCSPSDAPVVSISSTRADVVCGLTTSWHEPLKPWAVSMRDGQVGSLWGGMLVGSLGGVSNAPAPETVGWLVVGGWVVEGDPGAAVSGAVDGCSVPDEQPPAATAST